MTKEELIDHLTARMGEGGHGFVSGIPVVHRDNLPVFHEEDHKHPLSKVVLGHEH